MKRFYFIIKSQSYTIVIMFYILLGIIFNFLSVCLGAFGAHFLKKRLTEYEFTIFHTGVEYQIFHGLALILIGILYTQSDLPKPDLKIAALCAVFGIVLFSGSLYGLALTKIKWLGAITPIGGLLFLASWFMLGLAVYKNL